MPGSLGEWWRYRRQRRASRRASRKGRGADPSEMQRRVKKSRSGHDSGPSQHVDGGIGGGIGGSG
jgi:hypothetical protein